MVAVGKTYLSLTLAYKGYKAKDTWALNEALELARQAAQAFQQTNEPPQSVALAHRAIGTSIFSLIAQGLIRDDQWPALYPEGISALKKAIELDPEDKEAHKYLGLLNSVQNEAKLLGAKTGGCFIATSTYGSTLAPEVAAFRQFRDEVLLCSKLGRTSVALYYFVSPPLASLISKYEGLRTLTKRFLLEPILHLVKKRRSQQ